MKKVWLGILGASRGMDFFSQPRLKDYPYAKLTAVCESCEALRNKTAQYLSANGFQSRCHAEDDAFSGGASEPGSQLTLGGK